VPVSLYWLITTTSVLQHKHSPSMYQKWISQDDISHYSSTWEQG